MKEGGRGGGGVMDVIERSIVLFYCDIIDRNE